MRTNKKLIIAIVLFMIMTFAGATVAMAAPMERVWDQLTSSDESLLPLAVKAESAMLLDAHTGEVLFEKDADAKMYPASITKVMTCIITLANTEMSDLVTVGDINITENRATKIDLVKGETISVEALLYGLMLHSGNDAAVALAMHIAGSVEGFSDLMNTKAQEIGMTNTHFANPHGLHDSNHYTTARDMAKLIHYAQRQYPEFTEILSTYKYSCQPTNKTLQPRHWLNSNLMITPQNDFFFEHAIGGKTGHTEAAKYTFVATAEKENQSLIAVANLFIGCI